MRVNRFSSLSSGFSDSSRGNKEAQQTMSATCSPSWTRISPPPPSPASSPKWWSGETPPDARMAAAVLKSRVFLRQDSTMSFFLRFLSVCLCFPSLFFSLCLAGLSFLEREESLFEGFWVPIQSGARGCAVWSRERDKHGGRRGEKIYSQGSPVLEEKC